MATRWLEHDGGRLAYEVEGEGPLIVCVPGLGDLRQEYRFLAPRLVAGGYRVATMDLRGHGESSTRWRDLSAEAIGEDVLAIVHALGEDDALLIGTSMAAGAVVWSAALEPNAVSGLVLVSPFVRGVGSPVQQRLYRLLFRLLLARPWGLGFWMHYWSSLFPSARPADFDDTRRGFAPNLAEPERFDALRGMMLGPSRQEIEASLSYLEAPVLVLMGTADRDFKHPEQEAQLLAARSHGRTELIADAGHYPQVEFPAVTARLVLDFARVSLSGATALASVEQGRSADWAAAGTATRAKDILDPHGARAGAPPWSKRANRRNT